MARPCRLRSCFNLAPTSSRLRPHGRATPFCRCGARSAAVRATVTASRALHLRSRAAARMSPDHLVLAPRQGPVRSFFSGAQREAFPPSPVARLRARLPWEKAAPQVDAPMPRASLASTIGDTAAIDLCSHRRVAWSLHSGKRRQQLTKASATILQNTVQASERQYRGCGAVARPCRLRSYFNSAPSSSRLRPHGRATPSCRCGAYSAAVTFEVTASRALRLRSRAAAHMSPDCLVLAPEASPGPLHHSGAQHRDLHPSPVARLRARLPLEKAAPHRRRSHAAAPRSQVPWGTQRRSTCARIGRHGMVAAFGKAATTTLARQREDRAEIGRRATRGRRRATYGAGPPHTRAARFGRRFPRRAPPLWTPLPWHPLFLRNPQRGGALWLRGRTERLAALGAARSA